MEQHLKMDWQTFPKKDHIVNILHFVKYMFTKK